MLCFRPSEAECRLLHGFLPGDSGIRYTVKGIAPTNADILAARYITCGMHSITWIPAVALEESVENHMNLEVKNGISSSNSLKNF